MLLIFNIRYSRLTKMLFWCAPLILWSTGLVFTSDTARLLLFRRTRWLCYLTWLTDTDIPLFSFIQLFKTWYALYWLSRLLWCYGLLVIPLFTTRPFFFFFLCFFMILVTLISRSPCCSSLESGSQARQECKSWYVTYIFDLVTLKAVVLSTWFTSSGYSFVSNAIPLIFEITLESLCNHHKNGPPVFLAYSLVLLVWCLQMIRRVFCCPEKKTRWIYHLSWNHR